MKESRLSNPLSRSNTRTFFCYSVRSVFVEYFRLIPAEFWAIRTPIKKACYLVALIFQASDSRKVIGFQRPTVSELTFYD